MSGTNNATPAAPATAEANPASAAPAAAPVTPPPAAPAADPAAAPAAPAAEGEKGKAEPAPERVVPETYDIKLGENSLLKPERLEEIKALAKEEKLTNEEAQKRVSIEETAIAGHLKQEADAFEARKAGWINELKADKEIGAENAPAAAELTSRFFKRYADPAFIQILETTGLGNHPGLVKALYKGLKASGFGEGEFVVPGAHGAPAEESPAQILYGNNK